jgi:hypothetical protein
MGSDGRRGKRYLDAGHTGRLTEVESLQSSRDQNLETIKLQLSSRLSTMENIPDWLAEELKTLRQWRSQARLAAVVIRWRGQRFPGDGSLFEMAEAWRRNDKRLFERQEHSRLAFYNWRKNKYRVWAAKLAKKYRTLVIAQVAWKQMQDKPQPDEDDEMRLTRKRKGVVAPYSLQQCLTQRFAEVRYHPPQNLTATCHACGSLSRTPDPAALYHTCKACGRTYDQDENHVRNLLAIDGVREPVS